MKSIKYFAIAYLLAGAVNTQAMSAFRTDEEDCSVVRSPHAESSPFETHAAQLAAQIAQNKADLTQQVQAAFEGDMQQIVGSLADVNYTDDFGKLRVYKIGKTVYTMPMIYHCSDPCEGISGHFDIDDKDRKKIETRDFYIQERAKGNWPNRIEEVSDLKGRAVDVLLVQTVVAASHRDSSTPDEIRSEFIDAYRKYAKKNIVFSSSGPISDARLDAQLARLKSAQLQCTRANIATLIAQRFSHLDPSTASQMSTYLLYQACVQYRNTKNKTLLDQLNHNYRMTLYRGV